jgi:DNA-binding NtrC family response regulator
MRAVLSLVERAAGSDASVLITGEPGTGKRVLARWLHRRSHRSGGPLVEVRCATIPGESLEGELFGHERGAFPGAVASKPGLLELATGGTVLITDIDELHPRVQGRLLRVLELGDLERLGGTQRVISDVRILATSTRDLTRRVDEGTFRGDLYYRIGTTTISLPPLRERAVDIPLLARHFLELYGGREAPVPCAEAVHALESYSWPGNVRELRNVVERAVLLARGGVVRPGDLSLPRLPAAHPPTRSSAASAPLLPLDGVEREHIEAVLRSVGWHQGRAAEILGISPKTLYRKIRRYGFRRPNSS